MRGCSVVLVGLGDIGLGAHLPALLRHPLVRVSALVDPDVDRQNRARLLSHGAVPTFDSVEQSLGVRPDAVVLATPPWVTPTLARQCLEAGLYVLAEKPIATSVRAAESLLGLSSSVTSRLQVGLTFRHDPAMVRLREWVTSGVLGDGPALVRAHVYDERRDPSDTEHAARISATLEHGPPVMHEGSHVFDWLSFLLGGPGELVDAWSVRTDPSLFSPNLIGGRLRYPGETMALVEFGWFTATLPRCKLEVHGDAGLAVLDGDTFDLERHHMSGVEVVKFPGDRVGRSFARQLERFIEGVLEGCDGFEPSLHDALQALETSESLARLATATAPTSPGRRG